MSSRRVRLVPLGLFALLATVLGGYSGATMAAELRLMVEPIYTPEKCAEVYKPLVTYLSKTTGNKVVLVTSRNYHFFWRDLRQNVPAELFFAEAHFTDYRAKRFQYEPIVKTVEKTSYTLLASDQIQKPSLASLVGKNTVTMPSPSLGFVLLVEFYPNPVSQPNILSSAASWKDGVEAVFAGESDAAIVPTWLKDQYPNLQAIKTSREFPGTALSVAPNLDPKVKDDVKAAMLKLHEDKDAFAALNELGVSQFVEANPKEYDGMETMLKGIYGYQ